VCEREGAGARIEPERPWVSVRERAPATDHHWLCTAQVAIESGVVPPKTWHVAADEPRRVVLLVVRLGGGGDGGGGG